jgi:tryptophan halogenase
MQIKNVTIIGGGSSGWMTAAALAKNCPNLNITLVESPDIKTVGVGESTLGHINRFLYLLGLKDEDWMPACHATYKNSIRFTNFRENKGESFHYPFLNDFDWTDAHNGLTSWSELATYWPEEFPPETFSQLFAPANTYLCDNNKQTDNKKRTLRHFNFESDTAYHMNAGLFGQYLKDKVAIPNGVKHILNEVSSHEKDEEGNIKKIICKDGSELTADLWIDCTGFRSQLLEQWMDSKFTTFDHTLMNDSAWATPIDYNDREKEMVPYTDCHALGSGWVWNTPLWSRIGKGYVFSSKFISKEDAKEEFLEHITKVHGQKSADKARDEMRFVPIKHGKREKGWVKNVVGIGLSYGFIEPLESTGLLTTHENIIRLMDILNRRDGYVTRMEIETYNHITEIVTEGFAGFVAGHYAFSKRNDTPYWRYVTQEIHYQPTMDNQFKSRQDTYSSLAVNLSDYRYDNTQQGLAFIMAGMGVKCVSTPSIIEHYTRSANQSMEGVNKTREKFYITKQIMSDYIDTLPTNYQFMKDRIYGGKDDYAK